MLKALSEIGMSAVARQAEFANGFVHPARLLVTNADHFGSWMVLGELEQVAHVEVVKIDAGNPPCALCFHGAK